MTQQDGPDRELSLGAFVRARRKANCMTQQELAELAAVGLRFLKELEQDKPTLRMDTRNAVLAVFGKRLGAVDASPSRSHWDPMGIVLVCNQGIAFRQPTHRG